jgi:hypothetical protein
MAVAAALLGVSAPLAKADALAEVAALTSLKLDAAKLEKGDIISARNRAGGLPKGGQAIESVYVVSAPLEKTVETLKTWNGGKQADKVYLHEDLGGSPSAADFKKLSSAPSNSAVKAFVSSTGKGQVQVGAGEAEKAPKASGISAPEFVGFWSGVLSKRAQAFVSGGLPALPAYSVGGDKISAAGEANALLKAVPKISAQFRSVLNAAGLSGKPAKPELYWELVNAEGTGIVNLGAAQFTTGKTAQAAEIQYYASGSFYVFITVQQFWPTQQHGKPATLVYRSDLISSAELARLRGIEQAAAGSAMAKEVAKTISYFQKDAGR